jgi:hypothetical protein
LADGDDGRVPLALDQNFAQPILDDLDRFIIDTRLVPLPHIHPALPNMPDRQLLIALDGMAWPGLVTNNYKMMQNPSEIAALLRTKLSLFVIEGVGHDPIRATGALLLDLPGALKKRVPDRAEVFWMRPRNPEPQLPWDLFTRAAERQDRTGPDLYEELKVNDSEAAAAVPEG